MYRVCTTKRELAAGKELFLELFKPEKHEGRKVEIKWRPASISCEVIELPDQGFWYYFKEDWYLFGRIKDIDKKGKARILCETNFPKSKLNRRKAGVILRDDIGNYCIAHRGNIGGGVKGRGKTTFWNLYGGTAIDVQDGDKITTVAVVCALGNPEAGMQVTSFLQQVSSIHDSESKK